MATFNKFYSFTEAVAEKVHNLGSDTLKVMLTNTVPVATNTQRSNITDLSTSGGYVNGGLAVTTTSSSQTAGLYKLVVGDAQWIASGATIGPFRYAVLYNSTATNGELIGWHDYGSSITLAIGETFTWDADPTNGILTIGA
jgi:hypothetical protein